jgi:hypothetical protein
MPWSPQIFYTGLLIIKHRLNNGISQANDAFGLYRFYLLNKKRFAEGSYSFFVIPAKGPTFQKVGYVNVLRRQIGLMQGCLQRFLVPQTYSLPSLSSRAPGLSKMITAGAAGLPSPQMMRDFSVHISHAL